MAWRCSGGSNAELVANLQAGGLLRSSRVRDAFSFVDRGHYVQDKGTAYQDSPQPIGHGATISAPHMHAEAAEHLKDFITQASHVLDVGCGSGYLLGVFHELQTAGQQDGRPQTGKIVGIDHIQALTDKTTRNLVSDGRGEALETGQLQVVTGDGRQGYPQGAPYDCIHVGAAAPSVPQALVDQLASPGRMFIPVGISSQSIMQVDKSASGEVTQRRIMGVRYIPLCDKEEQTSDF